MTAQSADSPKDPNLHEALKKKFEDALRELKAMAKAGPINEKRVEELASDLSRGLMEAAVVMRGREATGAPPQCPECHGHTFHPVRGFSPPDGKKKAGG